MARTVTERADILPVLAEVFREYGYEGASLSLIGGATKLGKGSLYHFFPGGKEEMASAVLAEVDHWFETQIYAPLRDSDASGVSIVRMFEAVDAYFRSGRRICLVGAFALADTRDQFAAAIHSYFLRWVAALALALQTAGHPPGSAAALAEELVGGIQGAIVLSRALDDPDVFRRILARLAKSAVP